MDLQRDGSPRTSFSYVGHGGYDKDAVDSFITEMTADLRRALEVGRGEGSMGAYDELATRVMALLWTAKRDAERVVLEARRDAASLVSEAVAEARESRRRAEAAAEDVRLQARQKSAQLMLEASRHNEVARRTVLKHISRSGIATRPDDQVLTLKRQVFVEILGIDKAIASLRDATHDKRSRDSSHPPASSSTTILVVCSANQCRSPMAAALLEAEFAKSGYDDVSVISAGTRAMDGFPATSQTREIMRLCGIDISAHRSHRLNADDLAKADLVLVMSQEQIADVKAIAPRAQPVLFGGITNIDLRHFTGLEWMERLKRLTSVAMAGGEFEIEDFVRGPWSAYEQGLLRLAAGARAVVELLCGAGDEDVDDGSVSPVRESMMVDLSDSP